MVDCLANAAGPAAAESGRAGITAEFVASESPGRHQPKQIGGSGPTEHRTNSLLPEA